MSDIQNCKVASAVLASRIDQTVSENNYRQFAYDCARQAAAITRSELEAVLRECREAMLRAYVNCPLVLKIDEVLNGKE